MKVTYLLTWVNEKETGRGDMGEQWLDCDYETACKLAKMFANASAGKAYVRIIPANEISY